MGENDLVYIFEDRMLRKNIWTKNRDMRRAWKRCTVGNLKICNYFYFTTHY